MKWTDNRIVGALWTLARINFVVWCVIMFFEWKG